MSSLERIVRPFQSRDVTPPQRILNPSEPPVDNVLIQCGESGSTKTFNSSYSSTITSYVEAKHRELAGLFLRVPNPGGVLIRDAGNQIIGAVGISGDTADNDEIVAVAGIEAAGLKADPGGTKK